IMHAVQHYSKRLVRMAKHILLYFLMNLCHELSNVQAGAARHGVFAAGGIDFPQNDGRTKHHGDFGDVAIVEARAPAAMRSVAPSIRDRAHRKKPGADLEWRRETSAYHCALVSHQAEIAHARRAVQRRGSNRGL